MSPQYKNPEEGIATIPALADVGLNLDVKHGE
jgi:hypothetical protein